MKLKGGGEKQEKTNGHGGGKKKVLGGRIEGKKRK